MGELFSDWRLWPMLLSGPTMGRKEGSAASDAGAEAQGDGLEAVGQGMAIPGSRAVRRLSSAAKHYWKPPSTTGLITLGTKRTGKPTAGNPHGGFDEAGAGNGLTVRLVRHSQRKRGATDRPDLRSTAPVLDPTDRQHFTGRW